VRAEDYARSLYKYIDIETTPIDLQPILEKLNIEVMEDSFSEISGLAYKKDGYNLIILNKNLIHTRKRFTLAHEIGHIVMPHKDPYKICFIGENRAMERAASRFAAELLMPKPTLEKLWIIYNSNPRYRKRILADLFDVSYASICARIGILGLNEK